MTSINDPLLTTIRAFEAGCAEFNRLADHTNDDQWDALEDITFGPALARIQQWKGSASSIEGAIAALRISLLDSGGVNGMEAQERMVKAALEYLESIGPAPAPLAASRPSSIYLLLAEYWTAHDAAVEASNKRDATACGSPDRDAVDEVERQAQERWNQTRIDLCAFVPKNRAEARYKTQFLEHLAAENFGRLDVEDIEALLSSLPDLVLYDSGRGA